MSHREPSLLTQTHIQANVDLTTSGGSLVGPVPTASPDGPGPQGGGDTAEAGSLSRSRIAQRRQIVKTNPDGTDIRISESPPVSTKTGVTAQGGIAGGPDGSSSETKKRQTPQSSAETAGIPTASVTSETPLDPVGAATDNISQQQPAVNRGPEAFGEAVMRQLTGKPGVARTAATRRSGSAPCMPRRVWDRAQQRGTDAGGHRKRRALQFSND